LRYRFFPASIAVPTGWRGSDGRGMERQPAQPSWHRRACQ